MINVKFTVPTKAELMRTALAQIEKNIFAKAQDAARPHGGVSVRFKRNADGSIASVEFSGSEAAIVAAKSTLRSQA